VATPEKKVKDKVKQILSTYPVWYFMPSMTGFGRAGVPDFVGCINGLFFTVETKAKGGKPTRLQEIEMRDIRASGGTCFVVVGEEDTKGLEEWLATTTATTTSHLQPTSPAV
jgi:hypothetical protein